MDRRWEVVLEGLVHTVELGGSGERPGQITHRFRVDGEEHGVRRFLPVRPATSAFSIGSHKGTMTRRLIQENFASQLKRSYGWERRNWKRLLLAGILASGPGVAGTLDPPMPTFTWTYTLKIDDTSVGTWIAVQRSQTSTSEPEIPAWHFEPPEPLPGTR